MVSRMSAASYVPCFMSILFMYTYNYMRYEIMIFRKALATSLFHYVIVLFWITPGLVWISPFTHNNHLEILNLHTTLFVCTYSFSSIHHQFIIHVINRVLTEKAIWCKVELSITHNILFIHYAILVKRLPHKVS